VNRKISGKKLEMKEKCQEKIESKEKNQKN